MSNGNDFKKQELATITLHPKTGQPQVRPNVIRIRRQGTVQWTCAEGRWEVEIKEYEAGPFPDRQRRQVSGGSGDEEGDGIHDEAHTGGEARNDPGAPPGARGRYRYGVTVWVDEDDPREVDPEIVVGPER